MGLFVRNACNSGNVKFVKLTTRHPRPSQLGPHSVASLAHCLNCCTSRIGFLIWIKAKNVLHNGQMFSSCIAVRPVPTVEFSARPSLSMDDWSGKEVIFSFQYMSCRAGHLNMDSQALAFAATSDTSSLPNPSWVNALSVAASLPESLIGDGG